MPLPLNGLRRLSCYFILLLLTNCVAAQRGTPAGKKAELAKKEQKQLAAAQAALAAERFPATIEQLSAFLTKRPAYRDAYFLRSEAYRALGQYSRAEEDIAKGIELSADQVPAVAYRKLGEVASLAGNFTGAVRAFENYLTHLPASARQERKAGAEELLVRAKIAARLAANPVPFSAVRLSDSINTDAHLEYFPTISLDGQRMIFTRRISGGTEDFYVSERTADDAWGKAYPLAGINTEFDEGAQSMTADGRYLVYTVCNRPEGAGSCDLYFSERKGGQWTPARSVGSSVNTRNYEAQPSISPDGRLLFFSSNRPGGQGDNDLYAAARRADGSWSEPVNLGPNINTAGRESYPFWAADGKTLFFTSNGHPGLGGEDLFRVVLGPDNVWGTPENLGYPINTAANETNLFIPLNGDVAYFSKREVNVGTGSFDVDIYSFALPPALRPQPATYVAASVVDATTGKSLRADIRLRPLDQEAPPTVRSTDEAGKFLAVLPAGKDYAFTVDLDGYLFYADRFALAEGFTPDEPYQLEIRLQPLPAAVAEGGDETDGSTAFRNVLFPTGSAELLPVSFDELDRLVTLLREAPAYSVAISGHTDDVGEAADNQRLSEARAAAVKDYLVSQGIAEQRITTRGFGEDRPVAPNDTAAGRAQNRRTTFKLNSQ